MELKDPKLVGPVGVTLDLIFSAFFFFFMAFVFRNHVPSDDPFFQKFFAYFAAIPITGAFFMAMLFIRATFVDQVRRRKN